ncbi:GntR family transcriptional regulator [Longimicrobium sp.]|uniref:GntR family transcriptional regulator n=1 Tax=Longimicrobium sp. TaxID=2029185 RepID=UPI003B3B5587
MNSSEVQRHLRYRIVGLLHVGRLKRGDLLPSIRGMARELGVDHRAVASAYRALEAEGLVEIRPGSGVYLAADGGERAVESETARWLGEVLLEGWSRRLPRTEMAGLVERCAASRVRCACVESNEDHMVAIAAELEADFSLDVHPVRVSPSAGPDSIAPHELAAADLVVTTVFHGDAARAAAAGAGKPCVVVSLNPRFAAEINKALSGREVTGVIADPAFGDRAREFLDVTPHRGKVRLVLVDELEGPLDLESGSVLVTRAARRKLGLPDHHLVPTPPTYISPASARELYEVIVALSLAD